MLERIKLFRNKNKKAGESENAEHNVLKQSDEKASEEATEEQYSDKKAKGGQKR